MAGRQLEVAVLGLGTMGTPMARNLLRAGLRVRVWNRSPAKALMLASEGAQVATSPQAAVTGANVVITMITDGAAVEAVMNGPAGALPAMRQGAVWIQMGTVGVEYCDHLAYLAARHGVVFVDAPVSGSSQPAEEGQLLILASGAGGVRSLVEPIFDALGRRTVWLDHVGDGSRLKLALNNWLAVLVEAMAETLALSRALGLDPQLFLNAVDSGPLAAPYAVDKANAMLHRDFVPGFPLRHAVKDAGLATDAAYDQRLELPLTEALLRRWQQAIARGHGADDVAAVITAAVPATAPAKAS
jgi:3-hydroxyisobutyrate dehydrogenase